MYLPYLDEDKRKIYKTDDNTILNPSTRILRNVGGHAEAAVKFRYSKPCRSIGEYYAFFGHHPDMRSADDRFHGRVSYVTWHKNSIDSLPKPFDDVLSRLRHDHFYRRLPLIAV